MSYVWQRDLVDDLRAAGLNVIPVEGWENRGRPASTGNFDPQGQHTVHHTGSTTSLANPMPTLRTLILGRPDLPGPLSQTGVAANGDVYVIAAGRCNHAGPIGKSGQAGMPLGWDGNALAIGDEVDTNGTQAMPDVQRRALVTVAQVINAKKGRDATWTHRHADISGSGKWDLGSITTPELRHDISTQPSNQEDPLMAVTEKEFEALAENVADIKIAVGDVRDALSTLRQKEAQRFQAQIKELRGQGKTADQILEQLQAEDA